MNSNLIVSQSIVISSPVERVWKVMTDPELIKEYLFGTETITDWKTGSTIIFQGEFQNQKYRDKGNVVENIPKEKLSYNYWSGFEGVEDKPENYSLITYTFNKKDSNTTEFTWTQKGFTSEKGYDHSRKGILGMLEQIKKIAERSE